MRTWLIKQHDEWAASDRRHFSERSMALRTTASTDEIEWQVTTPELMSA